MSDVTVTLTDDECRAAIIAIESAGVAEVLPFSTARAKLQAAAPGPLERLEAWIWQRPLNRFAELGAAYSLNEMEVNLGTAKAHAPTLAAAIDAALRQVEEASK